MSSKSQGRKIGTIVIAIILILAIIVGLLEALTRKNIANEIREEIGTNATGEQADVSFGSNLLLLSYFTGTIPQVEINTPSTVQITYPDGQAYPEVTGTPKSKISVTDLKKEGDTEVAGTVRLETTINDDYIQAQLQREFSLALGGESTTSDDALTSFTNSFLQSLVEVTSVSTDAGADTMTVELNDGLATITLTPSVENGKLTFNDVQSTILGLELPTEVNEALATAISSGVQLDDAGLSYEKAEIQDDGIFVVISGTNVVFNNLDIKI